MAETQTAYAKSAFSDPLNIFNFLILALTMPEVHDLIPAQYGRVVLMITALLNLAIRTGLVTHPVALIGVTQVKPVEVKRLEATRQGSEDADKLPERLLVGDVPKEP